MGKDSLLWIFEVLSNKLNLVAYCVGLCTLDGDVPR